MAITLEEMKVGMADHISQNVVDTFQRQSEILSILPFDDAVAVGGVGSTMTYGYLQTKTPSVAGFRAINEEYKANHETLEKKSVELKVLGGSFEIDRVMAKAQGIHNTVDYQMTSKIKGVVGQFHNAMINGDSLQNEKEFDGLDKMLVGTDTEYNTEAEIDLSTHEKVKANAATFYETLNEMLLKTGANAVLVNTAMKAKLTTIANYLGYMTKSEDAFGRQVTKINNILIIDLGNVAVLENDKAVTREVIATKAGITELYAIRLDANSGFCGVTLTGNNGIDYFLPDFKQSKTVHSGSVEFVGAVALKNTNAAGVIRNIKIK